MVHDNAGEGTTDNNNETIINKDPASSSNIDQEEGHYESTIPDAKSAEDWYQEEPWLRRSTRERWPSNRYTPDEYVTLTNEGDPQSYKEAMADSHKVEWVKVIQKEMKSLRENHTYDIVELLKERKALRNKWVYRLKMEENNPRSRYKARLVVKGLN